MSALHDSAPELLKVLKLVLRDLEQHLLDEALRHNLKSAERLCPCWEEDVVAARALIVKAEGAVHG